MAKKKQTKQKHKKKVEQGIYPAKGEEEEETGGGNKSRAGGNGQRGKPGKGMGRGGVKVHCFFVY
jgi:hypothetical protein